MPGPQEILQSGHWSSDGLEAEAGHQLDDPHEPGLGGRLAEVRGADLDGTDPDSFAYKIASKAV